MPVFKAHGAVQARIIDTASETFSAIRTVSVQSVLSLFLSVSFIHDRQYRQLQTSRTS